ncbi:MAG: hypothetical protein ACK2T3_04975 [Candidatus Promineifilaceae bacterium]
MFDFLPDSITPWLLGGLAILALFALSVTIKSWRESKRSPYFFLRMQAGKKMQRYLIMSTLLVLLAAVATAYAWQTPEESVEQVAVLKHAKPNPTIFTTEVEDEPVLDDAPETVNLNLTPPSERDTSFSVEDLVQAQDSSETAEQAVESSPGELVSENPVGAEPSDGEAQLGGISFSLDVNDSYQAVNPSYQFGEGFYTLYATFSYAGMSDGLNWSWSWQRNGTEIEGGNQVWNYGQNGPGYIYFQPEDGFRAGNYSLAIWVDNELQSQSSFSISDGVAANN